MSYDLCFHGFLFLTTTITINITIIITLIVRRLTPTVIPLPLLLLQRCLQHQREVATSPLVLQGGDGVAVVEEMGVGGGRLEMDRLTHAHAHAHAHAHLIGLCN